MEDASNVRVAKDIEQAQGLGQIVVHVSKCYDCGVSNGYVLSWACPIQRRGQILTQTSEHALYSSRGVQSEIAAKAPKGKAISHGTAQVSH